MQPSAILCRQRSAALFPGQLMLPLAIAVLCCGCGTQFSVHVAGNRLIDAHGKPVRLLGVSLSGPEYACVQGLGIFAGPANNRAIQAMSAWGINAVRIPLNEQCWLGINGVSRRFSGPRYRAAIRRYVTRLYQWHLYTVLDLHWSSTGNGSAPGQQVMADLAHAPAFWRSVAREFQHDPAVVFDLYNEPGSISWECWRNGCQLPQGWRAAGMQTLLDAVRTVGARQPVIATGPGYGTELSSWRAYRPQDPAHQLLAGLHAYDSARCATVRCWDSQYRPVTSIVPVIATELGERQCGHSFIDRFMSWADSAGVSYLAWAWNPFGCRAPALVTTWGGRPTAYGDGLRAHLIQLRSHARR